MNVTNTNSNSQIKKTSMKQIPHPKTPAAGGEKSSKTKSDRIK